MTSPRTRHGVALLVALAVAGGIMILRSQGVLDGRTGLALFAATVLLVPTADALSRRLLLSGTILLGWATLLWWRPIGGESLGRMTGLWMVIGAALAYWVVGGESPKTRLRQLMPRVAVVDIVPLSVLVVAPYVWRPYLSPESPEIAFANLGRAWDFMSHFSMTHMIRLHEATINHLGPAPNGQTWASAEYPQGYHGAAASVVELLDGPHISSTAHELLLFNQAVGVLAVLAAVLGISAISALPAVRRGGAMTWAMPVFAGAVLVLGPGAVLIANGYSNFLFAIVFAVATVAIAASAPRLDDPVVAAALVGGVVGVATTWFLFLIVALPAVALVLVPWRRVRFAPTRGTAVILIVILGAGLLVLGATVAQMRRVPTDVLLQSVGSTPTLSIGSVILITSVLLALGVLLWSGLRRHSSSGDYRLAAATVLPAIGLIACLAYGILQVTSRGEVSYYFWKLLYGVWVFGLLMIVMLIAALIRRSSAFRSLRYVRLALAIVLVMAATQVFGLTIPEQPTSGLGPRAPALELRGIPTPTTTQSNLMAAATWAEANPSANTTFVALKTEDSHPFLSTLWYFALTGGWTVEGQKAFSIVDRLEGGDVTQIPDVVDGLLAARGSTSLASSHDRAVICEVVRPDVCRRVVTWER